MSFIPVKSKDSGINELMRVKFFNAQRPHFEVMGMFVCGKWGTRAQTPPRHSPVSKLRGCRNPPPADDQSKQFWGIKINVHRLCGSGPWRPVDRRRRDFQPTEMPSCDTSQRKMVGAGCSLK
ncbi:hypothetical protein TNCV_1249191 [Trichonephila clavipes]|nr:hypothetical protein TNCV_1249191 [Trichonephila clavipes]